VAPKDDPIDEGSIDSGSQALGISAVERDTGLPKDTLRVWERRYGFPQPIRDDQENRRYPPDQVAKLRLVKRLIDIGHRPGQVIPLTSSHLVQLLSGRESIEPSSDDVLNQILRLVMSNDLEGLRARMERERAVRGLSGFITELVAPLVKHVGDSWMRGQLAVFQEHQFSELLQRLLRQSIADLSPANAEPQPRVVLTTCPFEPHSLGLLMAEAVFALNGCSCISLGPSLPLSEIVEAAVAGRGDVVALSFTPLPTRAQIANCLRDLRAMLPSNIPIWCGGSGLKGLTEPQGITFIHSLSEIPVAVHAWRHDRGAR
jgi:DNA-binding transcriptional MerR regulator